MITIKIIMMVLNIKCIKKPLDNQKNLDEYGFNGPKKGGKGNNNNNK